MYHESVYTNIRGTHLFVLFFWNLFHKSIKYECKTLILLVAVSYYSLSVKYSEISLLSIPLVKCRVKEALQEVWLMEVGRK
jgi:hypothetical protein